MSKIPKVSQLRRRDLSPSKGSMLPVLWGLLLHLRLQRRRAELPNFAAGPRLRGSPRSHGAPAPRGQRPPTAGSLPHGLWPRDPPPHRRPGSSPRGHPFSSPPGGRRVLGGLRQPQGRWGGGGGGEGTRAPRAARGGRQAQAWSWRALWRPARATAGEERLRAPSRPGEPFRGVDGRGSRQAPRRTRAAAGNGGARRRPRAGCYRAPPRRTPAQVRTGRPRAGTVSESGIRAQARGAGARVLRGCGLRPFFLPNAQLSGFP